MIRSAFTIDVECGINISMRDYFNKPMPPTERVVSNTQAILKLLARHQALATFFILGDVAKTFPSLVKEIAAAGHEVGVHSFAHQQLFKLSPDEAYADTKLAKDMIEQITGEAVLGYRAPAFSVIPKTSWALAMLKDLGFAYDSSIMPAPAGRYGWAGFPEDIVTVDLDGKQDIIEFPLSVTRLMNKQVPACGGGYLRLFPYWFTAKAFAGINQKRPVNLYLHPYEIDTTTYPDYYFNAMATLPLVRKMKLKTYRVNKQTVLGKLDRLLANFPFTTMWQIIEEQQQAGKIKKVSLNSLLTN